MGWLDHLVYRNPLQGTGNSGAGSFWLERINKTFAEDPQSLGNMGNVSKMISAITERMSINPI